MIINPTNREEREEHYAALWSIAELLSRRADGGMSDLIDLEYFADEAAQRIYQAGHEHATFREVYRAAEALYCHANA